MSNLSHPDDGQRNMRRAVATGLERTEYDKRYCHRDGHYVTCHVNGMFVTDDRGNVQYVINLFRDLTEQNRIEQQLRQAQKMETVGQLTGGVAHDFNNFLQIIQGNIELARNQLRADSGNTDVVVSRMDEALDAGKRGAILIQQLLAFSRVQALSPESVEPRAFITDTVRLLSRTLGEEIDIIVTADDDLPLITIDKTNLTNAILNLAINAKGAMPQGGRLSIHASRRLIEQELPFEDDAAIPLPAGNYLEIALTDTGCGMSAGTLQRATEPFFTTKPVGEGSGLGLGMVYGFVEQSGGRLYLESELGKGTTVRIVLPAASEAVAVAAPEKAPAASPERATGCILLVEDDPGVRKIVTEMLEGSGYQVLIASNGPEALDILDEYPDVTILFSDVVMPQGMSGFDLADTAVARHKHLKVLLTSGYPDAELRRSGKAASGYRLIAKPYSMTDILDVLSEILGEQRNG
jgi:signal transduction histidine kinase/CheY-like chemotaxis protein